MKNLHADPSISCVHRISYDLMIFDLRTACQADGKGRDPSCPVWRNPTCYDQANAASRPSPVIDCHALKTAFFLFKSSMHGPHKDPVFQGYEPQVKGLQQMRIK
jgi:hypothetical protein